MRIRHRVPTLFTLSMLDVFCCALGCASLLWLWNERLAQDKTAEAERKMAELRSTSDELDRARQRIEGLERDLSGAQREIASLTSDRDKTRQDLAAANKESAGLRANVARLSKEKTDLSRQISDLDKQLLDVAKAKSDLQKQLSDTAGMLARRNLEYQQAMDTLARKSKEYEQQAGVLNERLAAKLKEEEKLKAAITAVQKRADDLETLSRTKEEKLTAALKRISELDDELLVVDNRLKQMRKTAEQVPDLQSKYDLVSRKLTAAEARLKELENQGERMAAAETRARDIERDLINRKAVMAELQGQVENLKREKDALSNQVTKAREAADNRFAGIQLSGRRVVFLVDMSGSMKLTEENTPAPDKWPTVIETLTRVMKSLPDLEKFQVIVFSEDVSFLLGSADQWIDFDANTSVSKVRTALADIVPRGNTNMYAGMEAAFRFRTKGMDTLYLLSDGLPNQGPGLSLEQTRNLKVTEQSELLGKYIRSVLKQRWNRLELGVPKVRINAIGFFYESPDLGAFLWALSRENDGSFVGMSKP